MTRQRPPRKKAAKLERKEGNDEKLHKKMKYYKYLLYISNKYIVKNSKTLQAILSLHKH